jgi:glycosyltransferase involved in cell wall biosynthesis
MVFVFWMSVALVAYAYVGYPAMLAAIGRVRHRPVRRAPVTPSLSLIVTARNEEGRIGQKLEDCLGLEYPADKLEVIVASDASTDRTDAIVNGFASRGVILVVAPERRGKEAAQARAIVVARGDVLVFSDVATRLDADGLLRLARNFADPTVGCVSSEDRLVRADGTMSGEGMYVRYEMWLRSLESAIGSVVGLSGSLFAARREVCRNWNSELPSDFTTLLSTLRLGLRGISDPECVGYYPDLADPHHEYRRKVRTISRGMASLLRNLTVLNPLRFGLSAWQLFSHKLCRWLVPFALIGAAVSNAILARRGEFYLIVAVVHAAGYAVGVLGITRAGADRAGPRAIGFFLLSNVAILSAWLNTAIGRRFVTWEPSKRPEVMRP